MISKQDIWNEKRESEECQEVFVVEVQSEEIVRFLVYFSPKSNENHCKANVIPRVTKTIESSLFSKNFSKAFLSTCFFQSEAVEMTMYTSINHLIRSLLVSISKENSVCWLINVVTRYKKTFDLSQCTGHTSDIYTVQDFLLNFSKFRWNF